MNAYDHIYGNIKKEKRTKKFLKDDAGKPQVSLIQPEFLEGLAKVLTFGAEKYEKDNWKLNEDHKRYLDALLRHTLTYWSGEKKDSESGMSHLYHMAFNLMALDYLDRKGDK